MDWQDRIVVDPAILVGKPVIRSTRLAVEFIIDLPAQGWTEAEILRNYPGVTHQDIQACLAYASTILRRKRSIHMALLPRADD
jgi:uncharacterized protein (DUF433 family)